MFGQMAAQGVDQLVSLADQKIAGAEQHGARLLFIGLYGDEALIEIEMPVDASQHVIRRDMVVEAEIIE